MTVSVLYRSECIIGEGAFWHKERNSYFWVDISSRLLYEYDLQTKEVRSWRTSSMVSMIAQRETGDMLLCMQGGVARINLRTGALNWILNIEKGIGANRTNDGGCDSRGRLWIGTMGVNGEAGAGALYCINKGKQVVRKLDKLSIPNGLVWSPDNKLMYHVDSGSQQIRSYFFDEDSGDIVFAKIVIEIPREMGVADGMAIDEEGMLWVAHWGGASINRWDPHSGKLIRSIKFPVPNVSSCAFVGEKLDRLLITTARQHLSPEELLKYPMSGHVFIIEDPGVKGISLNRATI